MSSGFAIVDLFAGPGGLAEGFSSIRDADGGRPFSIVLSVEKEASAHTTLLLRAFLRQFRNGFPPEYYKFLNGEIAEPQWCKLYPRQWEAASAEALNLELGSRSAAIKINARLDSIREKYADNVILIGGPPCQAYSLVGRARNRGVVGYNASEDHRHFLYREYIRILNRLRPTAFVMENVKGLLSSVVDGESVFDKVLDDLRCAATRAIRKETMMSGQNKADPIPRLPKEIVRQLRASENLFVTDADGMIGRLNTLSKKLPRRYGWRHRTVEAFNTEMAAIVSAATDALPVNALYWKDQLGNWEAYSLMNALRVIDLARSCIWALARQDAICASLLARSTLETAAAFVDAARTVNASIMGPMAASKPSPVLDPAVDLRTECVISEDLERISLKTISASRLPESDAIYSPTNILTIIERISKIQTQDFVLPTYRVLCEAAHPNMLGRALYIHGSERGPWKGNELRTLGPGNGPAWHFLLEPVVAALSWGCAAQVSAFDLMAETIGAVMARLNTVEQAPR